MGKGKQRNDAEHRGDGVERKRERAELRLPDPGAWEEHPGVESGLIGTSPPMRKLRGKIRRAGRSNANVLICGETGTGKDLVARAMHQESARSSEPLLLLNCAAVAPHLLDSELFGHRRGAFTGADRDKRGLFVAAHGGTLLLDEIGEMSDELQAKLLRVLEDGRVRPVGAARPRKVDVRVFAATHRDLPQAVAAGHFREDLYHRLQVLRIDVPPLRERQSDILLLVRYFLDKYVAERDGAPLEFTERALETLLEYGWPGNVRELQHLVRGLITLSEQDLIDVAGLELPEAMRLTGPSNPDLNQTLDQVEADHIERVVASVNGNLTQAAKILGRHRDTLSRKLEKTRKRRP